MILPVATPGNPPTQEALAALKNEIVREVTENFRAEFVKQAENSRISSWVEGGAFGGSIALVGVSIWIQAVTTSSVLKLADAAFILAAGLGFMVFAICMQTMQRRRFKAKWGNPPRS
jgi:hypothetical protein